MSWDFSGDGHSRAYAAYGRYYESMPLQIGLGLSTAAAVGNAITLASSCTRNSSGPLPIDPRFCAVAPGSTGSSVTVEPVDRGLRGSYLDEIQTGVDYQLFANPVVGIEYAHRALGRAIDDTTFDGNYGFNDLWITNPGTPETHGQQTLSDGSPAMPALERVYDGLTLSAHRQLAGGWLFGASYTLSSLRGNYPGLFVPENRGQLWPNFSGAADRPLFLVNAYGPLPGDSRHAVLLHGGYAVQLDGRTNLVLGAFFRSQQGGPINYYSGWLGFPVLNTIPRGSGGRLPWLTQLDARVSATRTLGHGLAGSLTLDVFNVLNSQTVTAVNEVYTSQDVTLLVGGKPQDLPTLKTAEMPGQKGGQSVTVNPRYGTPIAYQLPLSARLGVSLSF